MIWHASISVKAPGPFVVPRPNRSRRPSERKHYGSMETNDLNSSPQAARRGRAVRRPPYGLSIYRDRTAERFCHLVDADFDPNSFAKQELEPMASRVCVCDSVSLHSNASTRTYERLDCNLVAVEGSVGRSVSHRLCVSCSVLRPPGDRDAMPFGKL